MGVNSEKTKQFLGNWYIIKAARNWIGLDLSFNQCDEVRAIYYKLSYQDYDSKEQRFEDALFEYQRIKKEENEER